jgi:hypothetical protein
MGPTVNRPELIMITIAAIALCVLICGVAVNVNGG